MHMHCKKCLTGRSDDVLGAPCRTAGCGGVIEEVPPFNTLMDEIPEAMRCPRREESPLTSSRFPGADHWQKFKSNGNRVCSYCGSLHPDDMFELVRLSANAPEDAAYRSVVEIEPTDKGYKIYVHQPGVRNASEGGIKFYTQHLPRDENGKMLVSDERQAEYGRAVAASHKRFELMLYGKTGRVKSPKEAS